MKPDDHMTDESKTLALVTGDAGDREPRMRCAIRGYPLGTLRGRQNCQQYNQPKPPYMMLD